MKAGDLVRFRNSYTQYESDTWLIGLLIRYETWEKIGTIFYDGKLWRISARDIQKSGRKDNELVFDI